MAKKRIGGAPRSLVVFMAALALAALVMGMVSGF